MGENIFISYGCSIARCLVIDFQSIFYLSSKLKAIFDFHFEMKNDTVDLRLFWKLLLPMQL